ncbi:hypothetical protein [Paenibacillus prosopidis]|uniref:Glycosyl transferase family 2 n=1 Tax=Paenibacillus prosopidis TaxID=630520 RepID=A0A368WBS8_9BACL|nr:hypothetical protein [Paenibacillus prosopidis]RCW50867.1 hypothetical protein DFP97_10259 [Paenibacillus prosopidis]
MENSNKKSLNRGSRAAILPYCGDPFLLNYWLKFFNKVWGNEIDRLYICLNSTVEDDVIQYIVDLCSRNSKIKLEHHKRQMQQGQAINLALELVEEDMVMLIEEDAIIFKPGVVDSYFKKIEEEGYEVVGSLRGFCSQEIVEQARKKWGCTFPGLWPNFLFTYTKHLLSTDRNFGSRRWSAGEKIEPLDYVCKTDQASDTFVNTSLQLYAKFHGKIFYVDQHVGDILAYQDRQLPIDAPWTHINGLSGGITSLLQDQNGRPLTRRKIDPPKPATKIPKNWSREVEKKRYENKVYWWKTFYEHREAGKLNDFADAYNLAIRQLIKQFDLSEENIKNVKERYSQIRV